MSPEEAFASAAGKQCGEGGCDLPAVHTGKCRPPQPLLTWTESVRCGSLTTEHLGREFRWQGALWSLVSVHFETEWQELRGDEKFISEIPVRLVRIEAFLIDVEDKHKEFVTVEQLARNFAEGDRYVFWHFPPDGQLPFFSEDSRPHTTQQVRQMERECNNAV